MSAMSSASRPWWPLAWVALAGIVFVAACYYPGAMSYDSAVIWSQARGAPSTNIYGAGLRWLWQLTDRIWSGPAPPFLIQLTLLWSGLTLIARALECSLAARIAFMLVAAFAPVVFVLLAHVWSDVLLLATLAFAVGALLRWRDDKQAGWLIAFWIALAIAATLRHNALPALLPLVAYAVWLHLEPRAIEPRRKRGVLVGAVVALCLGLNAIGGLSVLSAQLRVPIWPATAIWDLAGMSLEADEVLLPAPVRRPELTLDDLRAAYAPYTNVPIFSTTHGRVIGPYFLPPDPAPAVLLRAWPEAITAHPRAYLAHRLRLTAALFGSKPRAWPHELVYVDEEIHFGDNPPVARNDSPLHAACIRVAEALRDTVALAAWPYLVISLFAFAVAWRRRTQANAQAALAVLASGLAYAAPLPLIAPSAELRYLGWTCLAAMIGAALALASTAQARRSREQANW
ncbi:MAG: hypothetical protein J0I77_15130 [Rudaea sp.]|nr:hypothetical protein [Rudaea sp.]MBN8887053.1 hypothetical protein [Rudaea sp.]MBR0347582.1 hypothetical protein [Rudaea sp.]